MWSLLHTRYWDRGFKLHIVRIHRVYLRSNLYLLRYIPAFVAAKDGFVGGPDLQRITPDQRLLLTLELNPVVDQRTAIGWFQNLISDGHQHPSPVAGKNTVVFVGSTAIRTSITLEAGRCSLSVPPLVVFHKPPTGTPLDDVLPGKRLQNYRVPAFRGKPFYRQTCRWLQSRQQRSGWRAMLLLILSDGLMGWSDLPDRLPEGLVVGPICCNQCQVTTWINTGLHHVFPNFKRFILSGLFTVLSLLAQ